MSRGDPYDGGPVLGERQVDILVDQMERENVVWYKGVRYFIDEFLPLKSDNGTVYCRMRPWDKYAPLIPDLSKSHVDTSDVPF